MNHTKRALVYAIVGVIVVVWALVVDGLAVFGSPAYAVHYPAARLCRSLRSGMELRDVQGRIPLLGRPEWISYHNGRMSIGSVDSECTLDIDPATHRIVKITVRDVPLLL